MLSAQPLPHGRAILAKPSYNFMSIDYEIIRHSIWDVSEREILVVHPLARCRGKERV